MEKKEKELERIDVRKLFLNNLCTYFMATGEESYYLTRYVPSRRCSIKDLEIFSNGEARRYHDDGETYDRISTADIDTTTLAIWNQFIQKRLWSNPHIIYTKVKAI